MSGKKADQPPSELEEIEVTPEMVQAGARVLNSDFDLCAGYTAEIMAEEVFQAMLRARGGNTIQTPRLKI